MELATTNLLLGIIAAVAVLEGLTLVAVGVGVYLVYRRVMNVIDGLEQRQIVPLMNRVNVILDDVKVVSGRVSEETERVDRVIRGTIDRVDQAAGRVATNVRTRASRLVRVLRAIRAALETVLAAPPDKAPRAPAEAPGGS